MVSKLAYAIYEDRIAEEKRCDMSLGNQDSDWLRAEKIINFFESPRKNTWEWGNTWDDYAKYYPIYERLKCGHKTA
jgi:hypothetical protein